MPRPAQYLVDYYAAYAQDEWRVSPTLTVNYGLRYEYEPGVREADNQFTVGLRQGRRLSGAGARARLSKAG